MNAVFEVNLRTSFCLLGTFSLILFVPFCALKLLALWWKWHPARKNLCSISIQKLDYWKPGLTLI